MYIAAFLSEKGESAGELAAKFPGSTLGEALHPVPVSAGRLRGYGSLHRTEQVPRPVRRGRPREHHGPHGGCPAAGDQRRAERGRLRTGLEDHSVLVPGGNRRSRHSAAGTEVHGRARAPTTSPTSSRRRHGRSADRRTHGWGDTEPTPAQTLCLLRQRSDALEEALLDPARHRPCVQRPEPAGRFLSRPPARQLEQGQWGAGKNLAGSGLTDGEDRSSRSPPHRAGPGPRRHRRNAPPTSYGRVSAVRTPGSPRCCT